MAKLNYNSYKSFEGWQMRIEYSILQLVLLLYGLFLQIWTC